MTNGDKIRSMTDRELAELLTGRGEQYSICTICNYNNTGKCRYDEENIEISGPEECTEGVMETLRKERKNGCIEKVRESGTA